MSYFEARPTSEAFDGYKIIVWWPIFMEERRECCAVSVEQPAKKIGNKNTLTLFLFVLRFVIYSSTNSVAKCCGRKSKQSKGMALKDVLLNSSSRCKFCPDLSCWEANIICRLWCLANPVAPQDWQHDNWHTFPSKAFCSFWHEQALVLTH